MPAPRGQQFERAVTKAFNAFFKEANVKAYAYRLAQIKFKKQCMDILVDSPNKNYYLGIECKIRTILPGVPGLYFDDRMKAQTATQVKFLNRTGRKGYFAIEFRNRPPGSRIDVRVACLVPHEDIYKMILAKKPSFTLSDSVKYPILHYEYGEYSLPEELTKYV